MFNKPEAKPHVSARVRAYGKARVDIAKRAITRQDWDAMWKPPQNPFPFTWGKYWKQCIEYRVDDFASEVGFLIDVLGLPVIAFDPNYAMFTSPSGEFTFAVVQTPEGSYSSPADAIRIQFMVDDIFSTTEELIRRGIQFTQNPEPLSEGSTMYIATFQTPHGICMEVWGEAVLEREAAADGDVDEEEVEESEAAEEDMGETVKAAPVKPQVQQTPVLQPQKEEGIDDLFEEIKDEHLTKPSFDSKPRMKPSPTTKAEPEGEFQDEIQYVDDPEADYPAYTPIPLRK